MITLALEERTVRQLENLSVEKNSTVVDLAEEAIRAYIRTEERRLMQQEEMAYQQLHPQLLKTHFHQYVAIYQGALIDVGEDQEDLLERVHLKHPGAVILVTQVKRQPIEEFVIRSPRLEFE
jgi:hypothetical protein